MQASNLDWFSYTWFMPSQLNSFYWDNIFYLYFIPVIPFLFLIRGLIQVRLRTRLDIALPTKYTTEWSMVGLLRLIPHSLILISITLMLVALARPQKIDEEIEQTVEGIDILLLMDISESMQLEDFTPNRLEAAKKVATEFVEGRGRDRIGLVVFSGESYSLSPLTLDYTLVKNYLKEVNSKLIEESGTAIGNAILTGINRMRESSSKSKIMILLSDGDNTAGSVDPILASQLAYAYNIKIYTIGIGKDGSVAVGKDSLNNAIYAESILDETTLRKIAEVTEGKFFRASNNMALKDIFLMIDHYEKGPIKESRFKDKKDFYYVYLTWAIVFFLAWLFTKNTFLSNSLED